MSDVFKQLLEFGPFRVDPDQRLLLRDEEAVSLSPKAFDLLLVLIQHSGQVVLKDDLMRQLWPDTFVEESNLGQHVFQLRKALGDRSQDSTYIVTVPGRGYRFAQKVHSPVGEEAEKTGIVVESHTLSRVLIEKESLVARGIGSPHKVRMAVISVAALGLIIIATAYGHYHLSPKLTVKDTVVLADFANTTGDSVFDGALREGLAAQLEQSPFLNLLSDRRVTQTLALMAQPKDSKDKDARLTADLAREVCQRTASAAVLDGNIAQIGARYLLTLKATNCANGDLLANTQAQAIDKNHVLDALGKIASDIRGKLGESLASVEKYDVPTEDVTTSSLEALKAYSLGMKNRNGNSTLPIELFKRAIQLDPNFAMAYAQLGVIYINMGETEQGADIIRKAYDLRDHVSERERFYIASHYDAHVNGDLEAARKDYELWREIYPRDLAPYAGLATVYYLTGDYEDLLPAVRKGEEVSGIAGHPASPDIGIIWGLAFLNRIDEAKAMALQGQAQTHDPLFDLSLYQFAFLQGDVATRKRELDILAGNPTWGDSALSLEAGTLAYFGQFAKSREVLDRAVGSALKGDKKESAASYKTETALALSLAGDSDLAKEYVKQALAISDGKEIRSMSALALSYAGDFAQAAKLAGDLEKRYPKDTIIQFNYLPTIQAASLLWYDRNRVDAQKAIQALAVTAPYESGVTALDNGICFHPVFVRAQAYLASQQGSAAAAEFQKIVDHRHMVQMDLIGALAHLGLGRAYVLSGDSTKAKTEYQSFLSLWKDADAELPILKQATNEYTKLNLSQK